MDEELENELVYLKRLYADAKSAHDSTIMKLSVDLQRDLLEWVAQERPLYKETL